MWTWRFEYGGITHCGRLERPGPDPDGYRAGRLKTAEGMVEFAARKVRETAEPFVSAIRENAWHVSLRGRRWIVGEESWDAIRTKRVSPRREDTPYGWLAGDSLGPVEPGALGGAADPTCLSTPEAVAGCRRGPIGSPGELLLNTLLDVAKLHADGLALTRQCSKGQVPNDQHRPTCSRSGQDGHCRKHCRVLRRSQVEQRSHPSRMDRLPNAATIAGTRRA